MYSFAWSSTMLEQLSLSRYRLHWSHGVSRNPAQSSACSNKLSWDEFCLSFEKKPLYRCVFRRTLSRWRQKGRLPQGVSLDTVQGQLVIGSNFHLAPSIYLEGKEAKLYWCLQVGKRVNFVLVPSLVFHYLICFKRASQ